MNKPKIRFKGFEGEWKCSDLGTLAQITKGQQLNKSVLSSEGQYYVLNGGMLPSGYTDKYNTKAKTISISEGGNSCGYVSYNAEKFWSGGHNYTLQNVKIHTYFLFSYLKGIESFIMGKRVGSGLPNIQKKSLVEIKIFYPTSLDEQTQIAEYFKQLDSLINLTEKKISSLKQVKQASLQSMFPQEGETTPRIRFKGFSGEWEKVKFGTLGTTYSGLSGKTKDDFGQGNAQYITFLNVLTNAQIDVSKLEQVNVNERQNAVTKGDILFNTSSETSEEVGLCSVMLDEIKNVYLNSFCFGFRPTSNALDSKFLVYLMRGDIGRSIMKILAQGATRYNLSKNKLCEANVILPSLPEQQAIADYFSNLDKQIRLQEARLEKLKSVKASCPRLYVCVIEILQTRLQNNINKKNIIISEYHDFYT